MTCPDALRLYPVAVVEAAFAAHGIFIPSSGWTVQAAALARLEPRK